MNATFISKEGVPMNGAILALLAKAGASPVRANLMRPQ
jgi:hypothetical protein